MVPTLNKILTTDLEADPQPSKNYAIILTDKRISGYNDGIEAMKQVIYKILTTERYEYVIYSWNYGIELKDLLGHPITYVVPELERRITEALSQDDRINSVDSFSFDISQKGKVIVYFTVHTVFGDITTEKEAIY